MEIEAGRAELYGVTRRLAVILVEALEKSSQYRDSDPTEEYRLGGLALKTIAVWRKLLEARRGPKWSEEEWLRKLELKVYRLTFQAKEEMERSMDETIEEERSWKELLKRPMTDRRK